MKSYEFSRYYNPRSERFVFRHKGTGVIVDSIFKPMRKVASAVFSKFAKPIAKKALQSGISHAGDKLGKKAAEKSGDMIMKKLGNMKIGSKNNFFPRVNNQNQNHLHLLHPPERNRRVKVLMRY